MKPELEGTELGTVKYESAAFTCLALSGKIKGFHAKRASSSAATPWHKNLLH